MVEAILAPNSSWFAPTDTTITRSSITEIDIVDSYTPTGNETASWDASEAKNGSVVAYVTGTKLTIAGNGTGCIYVDGNCTFSNIEFGNLYNSTGYLSADDVKRYDKFENVVTINGLTNLNVSRATTTLCMLCGMFNLASFTGVSEWDISKVVSMSHMFHQCRSLKSLVEISGWDTGSVVDMDHLFASEEHATSKNPCTAMMLTEIDVSNWNVSNVLYMSAVFYGCYKLTELDLNKWNTSKVFDMNHIFCDCNNLVTLNISNWDVSNCQIFSAAFNDCRSLVNIDLSGWFTRNARSISQMFEYCISLTKIIGIEKFDTSMLGCPIVDPVTEEEYPYAPVALYETFRKCTSLTELDLSSFDTKNVDNTAKMFHDCYSLKTVYVSDLWDMQNVTESADMFLNCTSLVGEDETAYSADNIDVTYARVDGGADVPGYLTHIQNRDNEVLVQSKSLYRIGKNIRKALDTTDKYKPSEMAVAIGGFSAMGGSSPNAVKGTFTPEADKAVFSIENLPFKPCGFIIVCGTAMITTVKEGVITTSHINGVGGDLFYWDAAGKYQISYLNPTDPNATNYTENSLTINYTGWGPVFKAGYTYDYIISGGFEE